MDKIKIKNVTIHWAEGLIAYSEQYPKTFDSIKDANAFIMRHASQFPDSGGYDKHKFTVLWHDGDESGYTGRLDCKHYSCSDSDLDIGQHIKEFLRYLIDSNDSEAKEAQKMLDNYELN